jgi:hypothetical protein
LTTGSEAGDESPPDFDRLILEAATGARQLTPEELQRVLGHVAAAGFDPSALERARGRLAGQIWRGVRLAAGTMLSPAEAHYLRHVVVGQEWPSGLSLQEYVESVRSVILDPSSGVAVSRYQGTWQLSVLRRSQSLRGPHGNEWVLVEYRVATGHWVTAFQPTSGLLVLQDPSRTDVRWLRQPG